MITSRGCPFKCIFCVGRKMVGSKVRYRDPAKVVDEMELLATYGFSQINLADALVAPDVLRALAQFIVDCADRMEQPGARFSHDHFRPEKVGRRTPDIVVCNPRER